MENEEEIWKVYLEYPWIEVSNLGRVRTKDRYVRGKNGSKRLIKGRILKQHLTKDGYKYISFGVNGKTVNLKVSRAVAICFIPNSDNLPEVNHIDCNRTNNRADNLEWCTHQENIMYRDKLGHCVNNNPGRPVIAINPETSEVFWFESQSEAARQLGADQRNIFKVIKGKINKTHGWWFAYADSNVIEKTKKKFGDEIACKVEKLIRKI